MKFFLSITGYSEYDESSGVPDEQHGPAQFLKNLLIQGGEIGE